MQSASEMRIENKLLVVVALTAALAKGATTMQCYQCTVTSPAYGNDTKLCSQFDYSDKFVVDCPHSTMCMKRDIRLDILNGVEVKTAIRDCASQKLEMHVYLEGRWVPHVDVLEPYTEGCSEVDDKGVRASPARYCYCRGNLCNTAPATNNESLHTDAMAVLIVFNLLKYLRGLR